MTNIKTTTPFYDQHIKAGAKIVPFAGVEMPLHYESGIIKEHEWVRTRAGLFDVSHMGQCLVHGKGATGFLSRVTPSDFNKVSIMQCKYTVLTTEGGGIVDDLIITRLEEDKYHLVLNASRNDHDLIWLKNHLTGDVNIEPFAPRTALIALQGPYAEEALMATLNPNAHIPELGFMRGLQTTLMGADVLITRTGYTGEDGFEIAITGDENTARHIWLAICGHDNVKPVGLGARDSLRLEAGYPLYGHDIDETTTPVEASLSWVISKGHSGFLGEEVIKRQLVDGPERKRFGVRITEKGVAREGTRLYSPDGHKIGTLTSGGFSPTTKMSVGQGYIKTDYAIPDKIILAEVRNRRLRARTHGLNFINPRDIKPGA